MNVCQMYETLHLLDGVPSELERPGSEEVRESREQSGNFIGSQGKRASKSAGLNT